MSIKNLDCEVSYMREYPFDYTISRENSPAKFKEACAKIEAALPEFQKQKLLVDVDGSTIQIYNNDSHKIVIYDDYDIGAVFVKSSVSLDSVF